MNKLSPALFILFNVYLSIVLIWIFARLEPIINQTFFPTYQEAEIQTYMLGLGLFFLFQIIWYRLIATKNTGGVRLSLSLKSLIAWLVTILLLVVAYRFFASVEQSEHVQQTLWWMGFSTVKTLRAVHAFWGVGIFIAIVFLLFSNTYRGTRWTRSVHILACVIIFFLTIGIPKLNLYDYTHYAGPIHDILIGNPPLTSRSWYGFFPIVLLSILFRVIPLTAASLHITITVVHYLGFLLYYKVLDTILQDARLALIGALYAIFASHLVMIGGINEHPQNTFIRMGAWLIVALTIVYQSVLMKKLGKIALTLPPIVTVLSLFWTLDVGLYTLEAYCLYMLLMNLNDHVTIFIKQLSRTIGVVAGCIIAVFGFVNLVYFVMYHRLPMWYTHYFFITRYQASNHMLPVPHEPWLWISVLIPVATIGFLVSRMKQQQGLTHVQSGVLFVAVASLTYFSYFLGRTTLNQLHNVILPILVCAFYLIKIGLDHARRSPFPIAIASIILVGTILGVPGTLLAYEGIQYLKIANPVNTLRIVRGEMSDEYDWFGPTVKSIQSKYSEEIKSGNFTLLSIWDTWYLTLLHTTNRVGINCQLCYVPDENVDFQVGNIRNSPSQYLFLDKERSENDYGARVTDVFSNLTSEYHYVETIGLLDVYKRY